MTTLTARGIRMHIPFFAVTGLLALNLSFTIAAQANAGGTLVDHTQVIKTDDGKTAHCSTSADLNQTGYRPLWFGVKAEGEQIKTHISLAAVVCRESADGQQFQLRTFNQDLTMVDPKSGKTFTLKFKDMKLIWQTESQKVLGRVATEDKGMQVFHFVSSPAELLKASELKRLNEGESISVATEFFLRGQVARSRPGFVARFNPESGGKYELRFVISRDAGTKALVISNMQMQ